MLFNGIDLEPYFRIKDIRGRGLINRKINSIYVPGMKGEHISSIETPAKILELDIRIIDKDLRKAIDTLNGIFATDKPVPIVFPDEPDKTYYGTVESSEETGEKVHLGRHDTTLFIRRSDPLKYGGEISEQFQSDALTIQNEGTAESSPVIEAVANQSVTSFMVTKNDKEYFMIGSPYDIDKQVIEQFPEVARWQMNSLVGWSPMTGGFLLDDEVTGGRVSGTSIVVENGTSFVPQSYGTNQAGWFGPAVRTSLPKSVGDFSLTFGVSASNNGNGIGKVMALFLDENEDIVCSLGLINTRLGTRNIRVVARLNDGKNIRRRRVMDYPGDAGPESTVFSGQPLNIRLRREGNKFEAYTWQVRDGVQHARHQETIIDDNPDFQRPIRQVVLFFAKFGSNPVFPMKIYGLRVHENNTLLLDENMIPYIMHAGDKVVVNTKEESVMINDEPVTDLKDFGADYFSVDPGINHLFTFPEGVFDTNLKYRPAWR